VAAELACLLACAASTRGQEVPVFSAGVESVRLDVLVTDRDRVITGLQASDFEVRDEGVLQDVEIVGSGMPLNLILALDTSASLAGEPFEHLLSAGQALLDRLRPEDLAGLVTFSHEVSLREGLTRDRARLRRALAAIQPRGETALVDGSYAAMMLGETDVGRDFVIVFSDGVDTSSWLSEPQVFEAARRCNVVTYGVSVRGSAAPDFLGRLCWMTGGSLFELASTRDLSATFIQIFEEFRNRYLLRYTPHGVSGEGWHQIEVRVKGRRGAARVRSGYMAQSGARSGRLDDPRGRDSAPPSSSSSAETEAAGNVKDASGPRGASLDATTRSPVWFW
jgi:VWFA-related protein